MSEPSGWYYTTAELEALEEHRKAFDSDYPTLRHVMYKEIQWSDGYESGWSHVIASKDDAEVFSSEIDRSDRDSYVLTDGMHAPVLDIDMPAYLVPSSTSGHFHLYIDHPMSWRAYKKLLKALAKAGILEKGYVKASIKRKHTAVRVPWRQKNV